MSNYSIVIPTYGRAEFLKKCLASIECQTVKPQDVFVVDNNDSSESQELVRAIVEKCSAEIINFCYNKGPLNSGAVARNYGAAMVSTELVAFLDDDVVVDADYYEKIIDVFKTDDQIAGVQGLDRGFREHYETNVRGKLLGRFWLAIENFFEHSSITRGKCSDLRPSLAVMNPVPDVEFYVKSQWISTCAGVFKASLFDVIEFPRNFVKYSWNEYVFFSHNIYKKNLGTMVYTSVPKYRNLPTDDGRMPLADLVYMAEVYDLYVFSELFNRNFFDRLIYLKSRLGRFVFYAVRMVKRRKIDLGLLSNILGAFYFAFSNRDEIRKGNFDCYNQRFPLD
tara:strand:- start:2331 stop:3341 length:1011 start_codon:yes stop_codon:yes gene_type:complete